MKLSARSLPAFVVMAAAAAGCRHGDEYRKPLTPVRVEAVQRAGESGALRLSAAILPAHRVDVAFKLPGYVAEIATARGSDGRPRMLQEGDRVRRGAVLARLRQEDFVARLRQAQSQRAEADAAFEHARESNERAKALFDRNSLTRPDFEAARAAYDSVAARRDGAAALVVQAENALDDATLRSPIDGVILRRIVETGTLASPGAPAFAIADTAGVRVRFGAADALAHRLAATRSIDVTTETYANERFTGHVTSVAPAADPGSVTFDVEVTIPNADGRLKPGMIAAIELPAEAGDQALAIPLSAIVRPKGGADGYAIFTVEDRAGAPHARMRQVTLGDITGNRIAVTGGLRPGERVIVTGATLVADDEPVEILR